MSSTSSAKRRAADVETVFDPDDIPPPAVPPPARQVRRRTKSNTITSGSSLSTAGKPVFTRGSTSGVRSYRTSEGSRFQMRIRKGRTFNYHDPPNPEFDIAMSRPSSDPRIKNRGYHLEWFERVRPPVGKPTKRDRGQKRVRAVLRDELKRKHQNPATPVDLERVPLNSSPTDPNFRSKDIALANKVYKPMGFRRVAGSPKYSTYAGPAAYMESRVGRVANRGKAPLPPPPKGYHYPKTPRGPPGPPTPSLPRLRANPILPRIRE